ncbi:competence protein ComEA [Ligilactobacillus salitolerans]|uniref:Competence protein ComEA n=1 Tax=Ligilactobacillus salitolerans TaxID=1808352 RepID=A0A401IQW2_9LACO|nr:helix-hairpin-helix domain-containing protein [Ligilactobacillus salitolerans]GBG93912.1 competence protein ComEA [Ligilactobacillus salitolerans]
MESLSIFWEEHKAKIIVGAAGIIILLLFLVPKIRAISPWENKNTASELAGDEQLDSAQTETASNVTSSAATNSQTSSTGSQTIQVDVKGAVIHPGVFQVKADQRVTEVLEKAGGPSKEADLNQVNLSVKLADQMLVYIPTKGENVTIKSPALIDQNPGLTGDPTSEDAQSASLDSTGENQAGNKINLNTATKEQLTQLNGIGDKKADQIIAYRQQNGNFKTIEDLKNVSGIGDKTFAALADQITV